MIVIEKVNACREGYKDIPDILIKNDNLGEYALCQSEIPALEAKFVAKNEIDHCHKKRKKEKNELPVFGNALAWGYGDVECEQEQAG